MTNFLKHKIRSKSPGEIIGWVLLGIIAVVGLAILFGLIIMWLWNWLMVDIFGLTTITYWQAVGLFILFKILFGGCGGGGSKKCDSSNKEYDSCEKDSKSDVSKWKHYDSFWKEHGDQAYNEFVERKNSSNNPKESN